MSVGTSQLGGKRADAGRLGKDRGPRHSRRSVASAEWASPPEGVIGGPYRFSRSAYVSMFLVHADILLAEDSAWLLGLRHS